MSIKSETGIEHIKKELRKLFKRMDVGRWM
jgi:hypothetical protein